jgi:hypothetical protein
VKEEGLFWLHPVKAKKMTKKMLRIKIRKIFSEGFKTEVVMFCKLLAVMLFPVLTIFSYANFSTSDLSPTDVFLTVDQIIKEQPDSIRSFDGERMYLVPHHIFATNSGLFLRDDRSSIFIPKLFVDEKGIYIPCVRKLKMICVNDRCGYCCWDAYRDGIECPVCGYPGDPAN